MMEITWSATDKKAAHAAFDKALAREMKAIKEEAVVMVKSMQDDFAIWDLHDYLSKKRREIDSKYDYRYSVLLLVFARLVNEGWLMEHDLSGIGREKLDSIMRVRSIR
jgi:hypothetical protein